MNLDSFLGWIVGHSVFLIQILALMILASVSFVLFRSVMAGKDEIENSGPSLSEIEKTLRKVLDTTTLKASEPAPSAMIRDDDMPPPPVVQSGMTPEQLEAHRREVEILRGEIQSRENSLKELQKALEEMKAAGANATSATEFKALEVKVKELQAKLGEYEIIEDDIANLSTYKSENSKLKTELENLRKRLSSSVEETGSVSENVKQFSQLVGAKSPSSIPLNLQQEQATEEGAEEEEAPEDLEALEEMEASGEEGEEVAEEELVEEDEGEMEASEEESEEVAEEEAAEEEVEASAEEESEESGEGGLAASGVLEEAVDTDKLLTETKDLPETAATASEEGDQGQKLINEFEDFMKGS